MSRLRARQPLVDHAARLRLDLISRYSRRKVHARGYAGKDKMAHCAHIGLYRDVLAVHVEPRGNSPRGYGTRKKTDKADKSKVPKLPPLPPPNQPQLRRRRVRASCRPRFTTRGAW